MFSVFFQTRKARKAIFQNANWDEEASSTSSWYSILVDYNISSKSAPSDETRPRVNQWVYVHPRLQCKPVGTTIFFFDLPSYPEYVGLIHEVEFHGRELISIIKWLRWDSSHEKYSIFVLMDIINKFLRSFPSFQISSISSKFFLYQSAPRTSLGHYSINFFLFVESTFGSDQFSVNSNRRK